MRPAVSPHRTDVPPQGKAASCKSAPLRSATIEKYQDSHHLKVSFSYLRAKLQEYLSVSYGMNPPHTYSELNQGRLDFNAPCSHASVAYGYLRKILMLKAAFVFGCRRTEMPSQTQANVREKLDYNLHKRRAAALRKLSCPPCSYAKTKLESSQLRFW